MSKYTTEVRFICEQYAGRTESGEYSDIAEILHNCHANVIGNYPIFDETYRETLNTKILKHYYTREICEETVGLWKLRLNSRMNEIMPLFNQLYKSELLAFNPFYDVDLSTSHVRNEESEGNLTSEANDSKTESRTSDGEIEKNNERMNSRQDTRNLNEEGSRSDTNERSIDSESNSETSSTNSERSENHVSGNESVENSVNKNEVNKYSDTPQGAITGLQNDTYLTNARIVDNSDTSNQNGVKQEDEIGSAENRTSGNSKDIVNSSSSEMYDSRNKNERNEEVSSSENGSEIGKEKSSKSESVSVSNSGRKNDTNNISSTEDYLEHVHGKRGGITYSKMLMEYRETFLNIDRMVIEELSDLFFGLWE